MTLHGKKCREVVKQSHLGFGEFKKKVLDLFHGEVVGVNQGDFDGFKDFDGCLQLPLLLGG